MKNCQEKCVLEAVKSVAEADTDTNALNEQNIVGTEISPTLHLSR